MPRKKRSKKRKPRSFFLHIKVFRRSGKKLSAQKVLKTLIESIEDGTYKYPKTWNVQIAWRNREEAQMKHGEFKKVMQESAGASEGFDSAVTQYLESRLQ